MAKIDLFWCILAYFGRIPTVKMKLRGACFILCFRPPEFSEKYFQPKRSPNSPAPVKKLKKSRPRGTPLIHSDYKSLKTNFNSLADKSNADQTELKELIKKNHLLTNQSVVDQSKFEVLNLEHLQLTSNFKKEKDKYDQSKIEIKDILKVKDDLIKQSLVEQNKFDLLNVNYKQIKDNYENLSIQSDKDRKELKRLMTENENYSIQEKKNERKLAELVMSKQTLTQKSANDNDIIRSLQTESQELKKSYDNVTKQATLDQIELKRLVKENEAYEFRLSRNISFSFDSNEYDNDIISRFKQLERENEQLKKNYDALRKHADDALGKISASCSQACSSEEMEAEQC